MTLSADALYYRGTDHMTGYIGIGVVYAVNHFNPWPGTADSLLACESVTSVDVDQQLGYRLTLGLRYHRSYSFEIGITELYPDFVKHSAGTDGHSVRSYHTTRTGGFRVTFGYLLPLRRF